MATRVEVLGVHPVAAAEPVHLIEMVIEGNAVELDFGQVTQEDVTQPRENWQVAYEEQVLDEANDSVRFACFFHYLSFEKPLLTPLGIVQLPQPTPMPTHLQHIHYDPP